MLSVRPGTFLLPGPDYTPHIKFKTAAAILAVGQRLLCYNTCRIFLILRSDNCSRLLHLPSPIVLAASKSRGMLLYTGRRLYSMKELNDYSTCRRRKIIPGLTPNFCQVH